MKRVLFDTNVALDVVLDRSPHVTASAAAFELVGQGRVEGYVAGHAVTTIAYLVQRERGAARARQALRHLLSKAASHRSPLPRSGPRSRWSSPTSRTPCARPRRRRRAAA